MKLRSIFKLLLITTTILIACLFIVFFVPVKVQIKEEFAQCLVPPCGSEKVIEFTTIRDFIQSYADYK